MDKLQKTIYISSPDGVTMWMSSLKPEFDSDGEVIRPEIFSLGHPMANETKLKPKANEVIEIGISYFKQIKPPVRD